jgi:hypothetical protein
MNVQGLGTVGAPGGLRFGDREFSSHAATARSLDKESLLPSGWIEWFVVAQTAIPAVLYVPGTQAFRLPVRVGAYAIALLGFAIWWSHYTKKNRVRHPARRWMSGVMLCLGLMVFHPLTNSLSAGVAQSLLYFAILCPLLWVPAFVTSPRQLVRILALLLVCNGINSIVGVLQVYDPARWMPTELSFLYGRGSMALSVATYVGPGGRLIVRPPGLFDSPGAVCGPGTIAALLGLIFAVESFAWWKRAAALVFALAGISVIYLSQVRTNLVVVVGMAAVYVVILALDKQKQRAMTFGGMAAAVVVLGFTASTVLGGVSIEERFWTLLGDDPSKLYFESRGRQIQYGFASIASDYPFGAGLARWGMMRGYFGDRSNLDSSELWAEVQPNAWLLDGGYVLLALYSIALAVTVAYQVKLVRSLYYRDDRLWAAAVVAANVGTLALLFTFVPFATQVGLQYWFLEGALIGAMSQQPKR